MPPTKKETPMTPLQSNRYWARADAPGRLALVAALAALQVGQRLRLSEVTRALEPADTAAPDADTGRAAVPDLVEYTTGAIRAAEIDDETREVDVSFSSEEPYARWWGIEILGHAQGEVDMSWIASGRAPVLADHDPGTQVGVVLSALVGRDRKGRSRWRFGKSARAEQELQDAKDEVRVNVSVGYEIRELELVKQEGEERTYRVTDWRPLEQSLVSIPADMTVGVGRGAEDNTPPPTKKEFIMNAPANTNVIDPAERDRIVAEARGQAVKEEQDRVKGIMALATSHDLRALGEKAVHDGTDLATFRGQALDELHKRGSDKPLYQPPGQIGLTDKESKSFSVARYMRSLIDKDPKVAAFETECAAAVRDAMDKAGHRASNGGHYLPFEVMRQPLPGVRVVDGHLMIGDRLIMGARDLSSLSTGAGGATVATDLLAADFITYLRNATMVLRMGARKLTGLVGSVNIPRQTGTITPGWVAQTGAASESDATFAVVALAMKTAHGIQDVTRDLLLQGTPAVEGLVRADLLESMAVTMDYAALHGTGASNQPTGLAATAGIGSVVGGTNGAAPTWDNIVELESAVANNNAAMGAMGYLSNTRVRGKLKRTQKFASTNGQEIWMSPMQGDDASVMGTLNGYRAGVSNNVRNDLTKGSSSGVCSAIFFGNWSDLLIGEWGSPEILPDPLTQAANRIVRMHVYQSIDIAVRRAQSFSAMLDALHA
jgi:HK97 family phage major capsid protein